MTSTTALQHGTQQASTQKSPVYEYSCLFTHDIRRKNTKRWQDGFLRFHLFNKRVMVYDQSRNYIGDSHFQDAPPSGLEDGHELKLERGGVLVQVGERLSVQDTDLSDLLAKRTPKPPPREPPKTRPNDLAPRGPHTTQLQSRSANITPFTPGKATGWTGRAQIPNQSPFDSRQANGAAAQHEAGRAAKRQRLEADNEHVPLWQILRTSKASRARPSGANLNSTPRKQRVSNYPPNKPTGYNTTGRQSPPNPEHTFDLISSPPSPTDSNNDSPPLSSALQEAPRRSDFPAKSVSHISKRHANIVSPNVARHRATASKDKASPSSPPVSTTSYFPPPPPLNELPADVVGEIAADEKSQSPKRKTKPLRLATSAPRKMLYCQKMGVTTAPKDVSARSRDNVVTATANIAQSERRPLDKRRSKNIDSSTSKPALNERRQRPTSSKATSNRSSPNSPVPERHNGFSGVLGHQPKEQVVPKQPPAPALDRAGSRTTTSDVRYGTSALDAQFLLTSKRLPAANAAAQADKAPQINQTIETVNRESTAPAEAAKPAKSSLRRHSFDTSPTKPALATRSAIKRADTIGVAPEGRNQPQDTTPLIPNAATSRQGSRRSSLQALEAQKDTDVGPWSREAWDLFGWCPDGREETLGWDYLVAPAAAAAVP